MGNDASNIIRHNTKQNFVGVTNVNFSSKACLIAVKKSFLSPSDTAAERTFFISLKRTLPENSRTRDPCSDSFKSRILEKTEIP